jgi:hypothetical protein
MGVVALLTKQAEVPWSPALPASAAGARLNPTAPLPDGSGRFGRVLGRPAGKAGGKDDQGQSETAFSREIRRGHTCIPGRTGSAMPEVRTGAGCVAMIRLIAALPAIRRDIGHCSGDAVLKMHLNRMSLCLRVTRNSERQQDQRQREPTQQAPAHPLCLPVVPKRYHPVPPATKLTSNPLQLVPALMQIKRADGRTCRPLTGSTCQRWRSAASAKCARQWISLDHRKAAKARDQRCRAQVPRPCHRPDPG